MNVRLVLHQVKHNVLSQAEHNLALGFVGHWKFDEMSGTTAFDASGNENHGTLVNGPEWTTGKVGSALSFDGTDDYVDVSSVDYERLPATINTTVSLWVKPELIKRQGLFVAAYGDHGWGRRGIHMKPDGTVLTSVYAVGIGYRKATSATVLSTGKWYHVVGVYDRTLELVRIYVNGTEENSSAFLNSDPLEPSDGQPDAIGSNKAKATGTNANYFNGLIDEVRIYNRALSEDEITTLYESYQ